MYFLEKQQNGFTSDILKDESIKLSVIFFLK